MSNTFYTKTDINCSKNVNRMTVRDVSQKVDFCVEITQFFHSKKSKMERVNVGILKCKLKMRYEKLLMFSVCA